MASLFLSSRQPPRVQGSRGTTHVFHMDPPAAWLVSSPATHNNIGLTKILRGFKIPVVILDRFLEANSVEPTYGYPPFYTRTELDAGSKFLRANVDAVAGQTKTRIFIPQKEGQIPSAYAYIAYAWVTAYAQRQLNLLEDLPDRAPPGFADLRNELLGYANDGEEEALQVKRLEEGQEDPVAALFIVVSDERGYPLRLYPRKSDMRCDRCDETNFEDWYQRNAHRQEVHGCVNSDLPEL